MSWSSRTSLRRTSAIAALGGCALVLAGCGSSAPTSAKGTIAIVAAEDQYGNVAAQVGGRYVSVTSIETNPNTDPHDYEATPSVAATVSTARIVIQNGLGYDSWMGDIESASPSSSRLVIVVQDLLGRKDDTANPHLWYFPMTMPTLANALASRLSRLQPGHAAYFFANERRFDASLSPWLRAIAQFRHRFAGVPVATTEPVADALLQAMGLTDLTPWSLQADIMNGVDPSPQDISFQQGLFGAHRVRVFVYNQQVTDPLTQSFVADARGAHVPVVGVYETMPTPGYDYQSWMLAEVDALTRAVAKGTSTTVL
jgi:zinc/manganese transport system substrate-binding protein